MPWIVWQAQCVRLFPRSNANVGGIQVRPLFRQLESPLLRAFVFFECQAFGVRPDELSRVARC
jgi:hypothetical protein